MNIFQFAGLAVHQNDLIPPYKGYFMAGNELIGVIDFAEKKLVMYKGKLPDRIEGDKNFYKTFKDLLEKTYKLYPEKGP